MGLLQSSLPPSKPQGNDAPMAAGEGSPPDPSKYVDDNEPNVSPQEQAEYDQAMHNALALMYVDGQDGGRVRPEILQALSAAKGSAATDAAPGPGSSQPPGPAAPDAPQGSTPPSTPPPPPAPDPNAPAPDASPAPDPNADPSQAAAQHGNPAIMALAHTAVTIVSTLDDSARKAGKPISDDVLVHVGKDVIEELGTIAEAAKIHDYSSEDLTGALAQAMDLYRPKAIADGRTTEDTLKSQFGELDQADKEGKLGDVLPGLGPQTVGDPPMQTK